MKIVWRIVVVALIVAACVWGYRTYAQHQEANGGDVKCLFGCMTPAEKAAFALKNNGDDTAPPSRPAAGTASLVNTSVAQSPGAPALPVDPTPADRRVADPAAAPVAVAPAAPAGGAAPGLPRTDSMAPNAPNGMAFAGTGQYQLYRQGNLTWRLDTSTGHTCIAFATLDEWRKAIVANHGCGRNA